MADEIAELRARCDMQEFLLVHILAQLVEHVPFGTDLLGNIVINAEQHLINVRILAGEKQRNSLTRESKCFANFAKKLHYAVDRPVRASTESRSGDEGGTHADPW